MQAKIRRSISAAAALIAFSITATGMRASVVSVGTTFFTGDPVTTFTGLSTGTEVNGLTTNGITFRYLLGGVPTNGQVEIDGGPGVTNHIDPPNFVSVGNNSGTLMLMLPSLTTGIGYGFAVLSQSALANATTITLFNGTTNVGSLSFGGSPDPLFTGGFAGISSTLPFNIVDINFNPAQASAFAVDNIVVATTPAVPEPESLALVASGIAGLIAARRKSRSAA
jgi:hypothetical protein